MSQGSAYTEIAYLGLGGNVGDVLANMRNALMHLQALEEVEVCDVSSVYKTPPWGITDQDWFLNCCAKITTSLRPEALLESCLRTEQKLKRKRVVRWGPRSVDIDILIFGDYEMSCDDLTIPHPRMQERAFVMMPLSDIAPSLQIKGKTPEQWMLSLDDEEITKVELPSNWWQRSAN